MRRVWAGVTLAAVCVLANGTATPAAGEEWVSGRGGSLTLTEHIGERLYAASGSPASGFSALAPISPAGEDAASADLASDGAGDVLAVWPAMRLYLHTSEPGYPRSFLLPRGIWYAWQRPGRTFSAAHELALPAVEPGGSLRVAMNNAGEAAIAYDDRGAVYLQRARPGRPFGQAVIARGGSPATDETQAAVRFLGVDEAGGLLIVTTRAGQLQARVAPRGQGLGAPQAIGPASPERPQLGIAMNRAGTAVIAWEGPSEQGLFAAYRMRGTTHFGSPQRLTPAQSGFPFPRDYLDDVTVDGHDRAIFALVGNPPVGPTEEQLSYPEADAWDGRHAPPPPTPLGPGAQPGIRMSAAVNRAGDAAIGYGQSVGGSVHSVVHLSSNGGAFGPALTVGETSSTLGGACLEVPGLPGNVIGCGAEMRLLGAAGAEFFALTQFQVIPPRDGLANVIEIRSFSKQGTEGLAYVSVPEATPPTSQPASVVDFGTSAAADPHGRIHGQAECGSSEGACKIEITVEETAAGGRTLGRASVQVGGWERKPLTLALNRLGLSRLTRRGRLPVRVVTETTGTYGPTLDTTYQLTIRGRRRR